MTNRRFDRRSFIQGAIATGALWATARSGLAAIADLQRRYAPVKVARDRVIREVVGLRPYRPEGFVVKAERISP